MTDAELLEKVKAGLGITGTYQDETMKIYIDEVKEYLTDAGINSKILSSSAAVGVIIRGVSDLWNYGAGSTNYSEYFVQRAFQLKYKEEIRELKIVSTPGAEVLTTTLTVTGASSNAIFKYKFDAANLPNVLDDLSDWNDWDGKSDIVGEDGHRICVAEVDINNLALGAGITIMNVNLGC